MLLINCVKNMTSSMHNIIEEKNKYFVNHATASTSATPYGNWKRHL